MNTSKQTSISRYSEVDLHRICKTNRPEPRSLAARGVSPAIAQQANENSAEFAQHRIGLAAVIAHFSHKKITRTLIQELSGASAHTVNKYKRIWKENINVIVAKAKTWSTRRIANARDWLARYAARDLPERSENNRGRDYSIPRRDSFHKRHANRLRTLARDGKNLLRRVGQTATDSNRTPVKTKNVQALKSMYVRREQPTGEQAACPPAAMKRRSFFASLFQNSKTAQAGTVGAARNKSEAAANAVTRSFSATNEVSIMDQSSSYWKPSHPADTPPGSFAANCSESHVDRQPPVFTSELPPAKPPVVRGQQQHSPEFVVIDPQILDFDKWVIANMTALRERVFKLQQSNPKTVHLRGSQIISNIYRQTRGAPLA